MTTTALKLSTHGPAVAPRAASHSAPATRRGLRRRPLAQRLELAAVLSLLGSSAAYALFTLCHLG